MLEGFNADAVDDAIFDDLENGLQTIPNVKYWLRGQQDFVVGDRHMRKQRIKRGKPSILVQSTDPRDDCSASVRKWLDRNCIFVHVKDQFADAYRGEKSKACIRSYSLPRLWLHVGMV